MKKSPPPTPKRKRKDSPKHSQSKNLLRIPRLNTISLTLSCITGNNGEVGSGDGEDGTTIGGVGVELAAILEKGGRGESQRREAR